MATRMAVHVDRNPFRVGIGGVLVNGMGVDTRHDMHVERACAIDQRAERVGVPDIFADIVQRHLAWIIGDVAAGAQAGRIGLAAPEQVDPEGRVELDRIVFCQGQLGPARGGPVPVGRAQGPGGTSFESSTVRSWN